MSTTTDYPVGTKVRIKSNSHDPYHYLEIDSVAEVQEPRENSNGDLDVRGPSRTTGNGIRQWVSPEDVVKTFEPGDKVRVAANEFDKRPHHYFEPGTVGTVERQYPHGSVSVAGDGKHQYVHPDVLTRIEDEPEQDATSELAALVDKLDEHATALQDVVDKVADLARELAPAPEPTMTWAVDEDDAEEHAPFHLGQTVRVKPSTPFHSIATSDTGLMAERGVVYTVADTLLDNDGEIELAPVDGSRTRWAYPSALEATSLEVEVGARVRVKEAGTHVLPEGTEGVIIREPLAIGGTLYSIATAQEGASKSGVPLREGFVQVLRRDEFEVIAPPRREAGADRAIVITQENGFHGFPRGTVGTLSRTLSLVDYGWVKLTPDEPVPATEPDEFGPEEDGRLTSQVLREEDYVTL